MVDERTGLNDKQEQFCQLYTSDPERVGYKSYKGAYPNCKSDRAADVGSSRLLRNDKILIRIKELDAPALEKHEINRDNTNAIKSAIIHFNPKNLFKKDGTPFKIHELPDEVVMALDVKFDKDGNITEYTNVKKTPVLDQVSKQLGQYEQDNRQRSSSMDDLMDRVDGKTRGLPPSEEEE